MPSATHGNRHKNHRTRHSRVRRDPMRGSPMKTRARHRSPSAVSLEAHRLRWPLNGQLGRCFPSSSSPPPPDIAEPVTQQQQQQQKEGEQKKLQTPHRQLESYDHSTPYSTGTVTSHRHLYTMYMYANRYRLALIERGGIDTGREWGRGY